MAMPNLTDMTQTAQHVFTRASQVTSFSSISFVQWLL